jgi:hypothetical protein
MNHPVTFVNLCVDIGRGHIDQSSLIYRAFDLYKQGFYENLDSYLPLVTYTSIENPQIPSHRNSSNLIIKPFTTSSIESEFPNYDLFKQYYEHTRKDEIATLLPYYAPLVVLKLKKIIDIIEENPFNSDYFVWLDCYFARGLDPYIFLKEDSSNTFCTDVINKLQNNKFLLLYGPGSDIGEIGLDIESKNLFRPFGFFWGGNKEILLKIYKKYFEVFFEILPKSVLTEELIFFILQHRYPELFNLVDLSDSKNMYKQGLLDYLHS